MGLTIKTAAGVPVAFTPAPKQESEYLTVLRANAAAGDILAAACASRFDTAFANLSAELIPEMEAEIMAGQGNAAGALA